MLRWHIVAFGSDLHPKMQCTHSGLNALCDGRAFVPFEFRSLSPIQVHQCTWTGLRSAGNFTKMSITWLMGQNYSGDHAQSDGKQLVKNVVYDIIEVLERTNNNSYQIIISPFIKPRHEHIIIIIFNKIYPTRDEKADKSWQNRRNRILQCDKPRLLKKILNQNRNHRRNELKLGLEVN